MIFYPNKVNEGCPFLLDFEEKVKKFSQKSEIEQTPFGGRDVVAPSLTWAMSTVSSKTFGLFHIVDTVEPLLSLNLL